MLQPRKSVMPYLALFGTWLSALVAFNLTLPPTRGAEMLLTPFYWVMLPLLYVGALVYGYRQPAEASDKAAEGWRFGYLLMFALGGLLFKGPSAGAMFYMAAGVQAGMGFVSNRVRMLQASLAVACMMMAFAASRPQADIPLLLTLPFFLACFVLTLLSHQVAAFRNRAGATTFISPSRTWLGVSSLVVLTSLVLGTALLVVTPFPGPGPLQWKLDKEYLAQQGLTARPGQGATGQVGGASPGDTPLGAAVQTFRGELARAQTLGDALAAGAAAAKSFLAAGLTAYPHWWLWLVLLLGLAALFHPGVRLWLHTRLDWLNLRWRLAYFSQPAAAPAVRRAWERLLAQRGLPRPVSQTLAQHAQLTNATPDTRVLLQGFARVAERLAYGLPTTERHTLVALYLKGFSLVAREKLNQEVRHES